MDIKKSASAEPPPQAEPGPSATDRRRMTDQIGRQLRGMYDGLLNQPVPDRFMDLMKRLEDGPEGERDQ